MKHYNIAIVGSAKSGKSTLCNALQEAFARRGDGVEVALNEVHDCEEVASLNPDVVLQVVDSTDLDESLVFTPQLIDMHRRLLLAFTRYDILLATDHSLDINSLEKQMGVLARIVNPVSGEGVDDLAAQLIGAAEGRVEVLRHVHVDYGQDVMHAVKRLIEYLIQHLSPASHLSPFTSHLSPSRRYLAIRLLERPAETLPLFREEPYYEELAALVERERKHLFAELKSSPEEIIHEARHGYVSGALAAALHHSDDHSDHTLRQRIDALLTNRHVGFPILVAVLLVVFECTFTLGAYPQDWIQAGIDSLCAWLSGVLPEGWLSSMMVDGVVQGVGAVLAFLPNIVILFFFLSILEDVGYMARAAYLMDGIMHRVGLHGRSFIPMLVGFGCNVPAIMAARDIQNRRDRTLTMLMIPFMSCSARLPVYLLLVSAFFPKYKALVMISLYLAGIVLSILFALVMKHMPAFRKDRDEDYVSELPAFRRPTLRNTGMHIWERCADYLKKISTVILLASVVIWALSYFPRPTAPADLGGNSTTLDHSYLAQIGQAMDPVMAPLGFDWKMNVCILTGLPAKEAIVSTMAILYHDPAVPATVSGDSVDGQGGGDPDDEATLITTLREQHVFTPATAFGFMMFVLLYFPCIATIATLRREIGRGWAAFSVVNSIALAWLVAFLVNLIF
jgi:ferrous iron transport protein B